MDDPFATLTAYERLILAGAGSPQNKSRSKAALSHVQQRVVEHYLLLRRINLD
jgi:hypothetical protein